MYSSCAFTQHEPLKKVTAIFQRFWTISNGQHFWLILAASTLHCCCWNLHWIHPWGTVTEQVHLFFCLECHLHSYNIWWISFWRLADYPTDDVPSPWVVWLCSRSHSDQANMHNVTTLTLAVNNLQCYNPPTCKLHISRRKHSPASVVLLHEARLIWAAALKSWKAFATW